MAPVTKLQRVLTLTISIFVLVMPGSSILGIDFVEIAAADDPQPLGTTSYHSLNETVAELVQISIEHPGITKLVSIGKSYEGRDIWAMKVSDNPDTEEDEPEIYFNGNHHAREWLTIEVCLYILNYLTDNYATNTTITNIVDNRQIWVVPCVNPDGRQYDSPEDDPSNHKHQQAGWRKNRRDNGDGNYGVDLNRNYDYMWGGAGASDDTSSEVYRGTEPFSENETRAIRDFVKQHNFVFSISYHSYGQLILYPWGYTYNESKDNDLFWAVANKMSDLITNKANSSQSRYIPIEGSDLYMTSGSDDDWLYGEMGIYAFCFELYPVINDAILGDPAVTIPYDLFHPRQDKVLPVCEDNIEAALYLCKIADNPFQAMDYHFSLSTPYASQVINQSETKQFTISITNDGALDDTYNISASAIPGWTIDLSSETMFLSSGASDSVTLSVTVPGGESGGEYIIKANVTSQGNNSVTASLIFTVNVPYFNDVGMVSIDTFLDGGKYPLGNYLIKSTAKNFGRNGLFGFDTSLEIRKLGPPVRQTIFSDNMEGGASNWDVVDLDGSSSPDSWKIVTTSSHSPTRSWWCGSSSMYSNITAQLLHPPSFSLKWATDANLSFYHKYKIEESYDYGSVDVYNGVKWINMACFDGDGPTSFEKAVIPLGDFIGRDDVRVRFRFTSDEGVIDDGWFIDDVLISADFPEETTVYGPVIKQTAGIMGQDQTQQLSWDYTFTEIGDYKIYSTTLLDTDEQNSNNLSVVKITIEPLPPSFEIPLQFGWNLISLPLIQSDTSLDTVLTSISGKYDAVSWYDSSETEDPWKHHHTQKPDHLNDLKDIDHKMGLWIHITEPGGTTLIITGEEISSQQSITLYPGWNLVGYPTILNRNRTDGLNNLNFTDDVNAIWTFNASSQKWEKMNEEDYFKTGSGYYVHSKFEKTWEVPL
ncbi:MAG: hypothetical protein JSW00_18370 [Thermoplasmata archaeon]|nr:MAG: hypothetical protein JSW00_18370 [Thermoplasmata archaeon]